MGHDDQQQTVSGVGAEARGACIRLRWVLRTLSALSSALTVASCQPPEPDSPDESQLAPTDTEPSESNDDADAVAQAEPDPCAAGSCTRCGEAVCLKGFFCDEGAGACAWIPSCADATDCGCLEQALDGCSCAEREGGLYVTCADG